jgi:hypothetical protein
MQRRNVVTLVIVAVVVVVIVAAIIYNLATRDRPVAPPEIAGQQGPGKFFAIDFSKRYDLHCHTGGSDGVVRQCKILGFTGRRPEEDSNYSLRSVRAAYFQNWLVVEQPDGRRLHPSGRGAAD